MSRRTHHKHEAAHLSLYNWHTISFAYFLTIKAVVRKLGKSDGQTGSQCLDKAVLAQGVGGGGGGGTTCHCAEEGIDVENRLDFSPQGPECPQGQRSCSQTKGGVVAIKGCWVRDA